ncbi:hypothetical protein BVRB_5g109270 [Beta vulgaris subsp. vulgaris]|nr:hypothetical protein BVRB_5g109270 [Beta vulgaris subsp. vulgaris]
MVEGVEYLPYTITLYPILLSQVIASPGVCFLPCSPDLVCVVFYIK